MTIQTSDEIEVLIKWFEGKSQDISVLLKGIN